MTFPVQHFFRKKTLLSLTALAGAFNAALWALLILRIVPAPEAVPIHYNIYFGIDLVGPWWYRFAFPALGTVTFLVNGTLSVLFCEREETVAYFFTVASVFVQLLVGLTAVFSLLQL